MIGIIHNEDSYTIELWPVFTKRAPRFLSWTINKEPKYYGEHGISFSVSKYGVSVWIAWGLSTYTGFKSFYKAWRKGQLDNTKYRKPLKT